ncbi:MAG: hypothetical protein WC300_05325 [Candidatus Omnitrophota bacterium]|jgi:hypothetical protein
MSDIFSGVIRDIKPPVYIKAHYAFLLLVLASALALCFLLFVIYRFIKKRKDNPVEECYEKIPAHEAAYRRLEELRARDFPRLGLVREYYFRLSGIIRRYIEDRFLLRAPEMTTEEFLYSMRDTGTLTGRQKNTMKDFLSRCDVVKYARYNPDSTEIEGIFLTAKQFIDETRPDDIRQLEEQLK